MSRHEDQFLVSENMLMWSFRYALGRRTGAVDDVVNHLKMYWNGLEEQTREQIKDEIKTAINQNNAGSMCDVDSWKEILDL